MIALEDEGIDDQQSSRLSLGWSYMSAHLSLCCISSIEPSSDAWLTSTLVFHAIDGITGSWIPRAPMKGFWRTIHAGFQRLTKGKGKVNRYLSSPATCLFVGGEGEGIDEPTDVSTPPTIWWLIHSLVDIYSRFLWCYSSSNVVYSFKNRKTTTPKEKT